jgi:hypothetical protein
MLKLVLGLNLEEECELMVILATKCSLCLENATKQCKIIIYK